MWSLETRCRQSLTLAKGHGILFVLLVHQKELYITDTKKRQKLAIPRKTTTFIPSSKSRDLFRLKHVKTIFKLTLSSLDIWFTQIQYKKMNSKQGNYVTNAFQNIWSPPNKSISLKKDTTTLCNTYL